MNLSAIFWIWIPFVQVSTSRPDGYPSLAAHRAVHGLLYPVHQLVSNDLTQDLKLHVNFKPVLNENGADIHLVNLRTGATLLDDSYVQPAQSVALVLQRLGIDCCFHTIGFNSSTNRGEFSVGHLFPDYFGNTVQSTSLTQLQQGPAIEKSFTVALKPMEFYTFQLQP